VNKLLGLGGDLPQALRRKCALENSNYVVHALALEMAGEINAIRPVSDQSRTSGLLARAAQNRDRGAFADLFDEYSPRLKSFMMRKGASPELAEDLVQETMISVWTKAGLYDPAKGSVTTWIFTIARNLRIDRIRRECTVHLTELGDYDEASDEPGSDELLGRFAKGDIADLDEEIEHRPVVEASEPCICLAASEAPTRFKSWPARLLQPLIGI
jgi:RNA polymerase sigma factor (sigma-70 family)